MEKTSTHPSLSSESTDRQPQLKERLIHIFSQLIAPMGYQVIYLEIQSFRHKVLRVFIDHLETDSPSTTSRSIGIEDCVKVSRALDGPLETSPELLELLPESYELEVSSPGVDRPLRTERDFQKYQGQQARIHVYRPLTSEELGNADYQTKNPKQKNFLGILNGFQDGKVILALATSPSIGKKAKKGVSQPHQAVTVTLPLPLISKANLEPEFDLERTDERE